MTSCPQPKTQTSLCPYFPTCGGCDFLDLEEEKYRNLKQESLGNTLGQYLHVTLSQCSNVTPNVTLSQYSNVTLSLSKGVLPSEPKHTLRQAQGDIGVLAQGDGKIEWIWIEPHSRRKVTFQIDRENNLGFFTKKTNSIIKIDSCFVAEKTISDFIFTLQNFLKSQERNIFTQVTATLFDNALSLVFSIKKELNFVQERKLTDFAKSENLNISCSLKNQIAPIFQVRKNQIFYPNFKIELDSNIFIQATKSGLRHIIEICRATLRQAQGDGGFLKVIDLYAGFGAYSFGIIDLVKNITAVEGDKNMVDSINKNAAINNLSGKIKGEVQDLFSSPVLARDLNHFDLVIINPPRNGASPQIIEITKSKIKKLIYVSCNPQSFGRDAKILIDSGFKITKLYALDQFYATKHLEVIGIFEK